MVACMKAVQFPACAVKSRNGGIKLRRTEISADGRLAAADLQLNFHTKMHQSEQDPYVCHSTLDCEPELVAASSRGRDVIEAQGPVPQELVLVYSSRKRRGDGVFLAAEKDRRRLAKLAAKAEKKARCKKAGKGSRSGNDQNTLLEELHDDAPQTSESLCFKGLIAVVVHGSSNSCYCDCELCAATKHMLIKHGCKIIPRSDLMRKKDVSPALLLEYLQRANLLVAVGPDTCRPDICLGLGLTEPRQLDSVNMVTFACVLEAADQRCKDTLLAFKWVEPVAPQPASSARMDVAASTTETQKQQNFPSATAQNFRPRWFGRGRRWITSAAPAAVKKRVRDPRDTDSGSDTRDAEAAAATAAAAAAAGPPANSSDDDHDAEIAAFLAEAGGDVGSVGGGRGGGVEESQARDLSTVLPPHYLDRRVHAFLCGRIAEQGVEASGAEADAAAERQSNALLVRLFVEMEQIYKALGDVWRVYTYKRVASDIARLGRQGIELTEENFRQHLEPLRGFKRGSKTLAKVEEILTFGTMDRLNRLRASPDIVLRRELGKVWGVGPSTAGRLIAAGVRSVADLVGRTHVGEGPRRVDITPAAQLGALHLQDINSKMPRAEQRQMAPAEVWFRDIDSKMPRAEVAEIEAVVQRAAHGAVGPQADVVACGSYRRGKAESGDIDCLVTMKDGSRMEGLLDKLLEALTGLTAGVKTLAHHRSDPFISKADDSCAVFLGLVRLSESSRWRRLDIRVYDRQHYAFALLHMTGSDHFNRSMRLFAKRKGYSLSDTGLKPAVRLGKERLMVGSNVVECRTEEDIFQLLRIPYVPPESRHGGFTVGSLGPTTADMQTQPGVGQSLI